MKKILAISLLICMLLACIPGHAEEERVIRFSWWGGAARIELTQKCIDLFEEAHPGVTIECEYASWDGYWERLATQAAANDLPDVMQQDMQYLSSYIDKGLILPLDEYVGNILDLSNAAEATIESAKIDGKLWAVVNGVNTMSMIYDAEKLAEYGIEYPAPGYTWDDFIDLLRQLRAVIPEDVYPATFYPTSAIYELAQYVVRQQGYSFYTEDGTALGFADHPEALQKAFELLKTMNDENLIAPNDVRLMVKDMGEPDPIINGNSLISTGYSNGVISGMMVPAGRPLTLTVLPTDANQVSNGQFIKPSQFWAVSASTKYPELCVEFVDFMTNSIEAHTILAGDRGVPISSVVVEAIQDDIDANSAAAFAYVNSAAEYCSPMDPREPAGHAELDEYLELLDQQISFGTTTPEEATASFMAKAEEILAANAK